MLSGRLKTFSKSFLARYILVIFTAVIVIYGSSLGNYFIADDFGILKYVHDGPRLKKILDNFTGPWFGGGVNNIYRPIATILFSVFQQIFRNLPLGYHLVSILGHCVNSSLVFLIAHRLYNNKNNLLALSAGILYALFPTHPNVVMLISSLHVIFYTLFSLSSFLFYIIYRQERRIGQLIVSFVCFLLALGSYEGAVILPFLLVFYEFIVFDERRVVEKGLLIWIHFYYFLVLGLYFLARLGATGEFIGNNAGVKARLFSVSDIDLVHRVFYGTLNIFLFCFSPIRTFFSGYFANGYGLACGILLAGFFIYGIIRIYLRDKYIFWLLVFFVFWVIIAQAPFGFSAINLTYGRFFCMAAAGVALFLPIFVWGVFDAGTLRLKERIFFLVIISIAFSSLHALSKNIKVFSEAAATIFSIKNQVIAVSRGENKGKGVVFLDNFNYLYKNIFFYAFNSSMFGPPFQSEKMEVFLLPSLSKKEKLFLSENSDKSMILAWSAKDRLVKKLNEDDLLGLIGLGNRIEIVYPRTGATLYPDEAFMIFKAGTYAKFKVVMLTEVKPIVVNLNNCESVNGNLTWRPDLAGVRAYADLVWHSRILWWVEAVDDRGEMIATSGLNSFFIRTRQDL